MAATATTSIPLGFKAPDFTLPECTTGLPVSRDAILGKKGTVVVFMCNHCPFVVHLLDELVEVAHEYMERGFGFVAVSSNDVANYPQDDMPQMAALAKTNGFKFHYLYDASQEVAKAYDAACTPDFSLFDANHKAVYRGQFDGSRPGNGMAVTGKDLRQAMDLVEAGEPIPVKGQMPSIGCNIKWKA